MGNAKNQALIYANTHLQALRMTRQTAAVKREEARLQKAITQITVNVNGTAKPADVAREIQRILQANSLTGFPIQTVGKATP